MGIKKRSGIKHQSVLAVLTHLPQGNTKGIVGYLIPGVGHAKSHLFTAQNKEVL